MYQNLTKIKIENYLRSDKLRGPAEHLDCCAGFELLGRAKVDDLHRRVVFLRAHHVLRLEKRFFKREKGGYISSRLARHVLGFFERFLKSIQKFLKGFLKRDSKLNCASWSVCKARPLPLKGFELKVLRLSSH